MIDINKWDPNTSKYTKEPLIDIGGNEVKLGGCVIVAAGNWLDIGRIIKHTSSTIHLQLITGNRTYPQKSALRKERLLVISEEQHDALKRKVMAAQHADIQ